MAATGRKSPVPSLKLLPQNPASSLSCRVVFDLGEPVTYTSSTHVESSYKEGGFFQEKHPYPQEALNSDMKVTQPCGLHSELLNEAAMTGSGDLLPAVMTSLTLQQATCDMPGQLRDACTDCEPGLFGDVFNVYDATSCVGSNSGNICTFCLFDMTGKDLKKARIYNICRRLEDVNTSYRAVVGERLKHETTPSKKCACSDGRLCAASLSVPAHNLAGVFLSRDLIGQPHCSCQTSLNRVPVLVDADSDVWSSMWNWTYNNSDRCSLDCSEPGDYNIQASGGKPNSTPAFSKADLKPVRTHCASWTLTIPQNISTSSKKEPTIPVVSLFNRSVNFWIMEID